MVAKDKEQDDQRDQLWGKIRQEEGELDEIQWAYRRSKEALEDRYNDSHHQYQLIQHQIDYQFTSLPDEVSAFGHTKAVLEAFHQSNEELYTYRQRLLDQQMDRLEEGYRSSYRQQEDKIERLYGDLRKLM